MKKLLAIVGLVAFVTMSTQAATHVSQNLLGPTVYSLQVTNAIGITNLNSTFLFAAAARANPTNSVGAAYTNVAPYMYQVTNLVPGIQITCVATNVTETGSITNSTAAGDTVWSPIVAGVQACERSMVNLLGEATVYQPFAFLPLTPGTAASVPTNSANACISITVYSVNAAANSAVTFRFTTLADGVHETTTSAGDFTCSFTPAGTTGITETKVFQVPDWCLVGAKKIRLASIDNADTTANSAVWVTSCTYNSWQ